MASSSSFSILLFFFFFIFMLSRIVPSCCSSNPCLEASSKDMVPMTKVLLHRPYLTVDFHCSSSHRVTKLNITIESGNIDFGEMVGLVCQLHFLTNLTLTSFEYYSSSSLSNISLCLGGLKYLSLLDLSRNFLSGEIPESFSKLSNLAHLDLSSNSLSGEIPESFSKLSNLAYLALSGNSLSGEIPASFSKLSNLAHLDLSSNSLSGEIPESFSKLSNLAYLALSGNSLSGEIPASFSKLSNLAYLYVVMTNILIHGDLISLTHLGLSHTSNNFTNLCNLTRLTDLYLYNSNLVLNASILACNSSLQNLRNLEINVRTLKSPGALSPTLSTLINLQSLELYSENGGHLEDPIPLSALCSLAKVESVEIDSIYMKSTSLSNCSFNSLNSLSLRNNNMSGLLPSLDAPQLSYIDLSGNTFSGPIPQQWQNWTQMTYLSLSSVTSMKQIPDWLFRLPLKLLRLESCDLRHIPCSSLSLLNTTRFDLSLSGNNLTGDILWCLASVPFSKLDYLDLSLNPLNTIIPPNISLPTINFSMCGLYGKLPPNLFQLNSPFDFSLDVSVNSLSGEIPYFVWNISSYVLDFSNNMFTSVRSTAATMTKSLSPRVLRLSNNRINSSFYDLFTPAMFVRCYLETLDISNNSFYGDIPPALGNCSDLVYLFMQDNRLEGVIPSQLSQLQNLEMMSLRNNSLVRIIPRSMSNCTAMKLWDVSHNRIRDTLENSPIKEFRMLRVLVLASNQFHGNIPKWIGNFSPHLQFLDMSGNQLSGTIPNNLSFPAFRSCIAYDSKLIPDFSYRSRRRYNIQLLQYHDKGSQLNYTYVIDGLKCLDLSNNSLSGEIPLEFGYLHGMHSLKLSHNKFIGNIPKTIGQLTCLESLELSSNELNGTIPTELGNISFLAYLQLGHNHLSGRIPTATQLQTLDNDSYLPNDGLCGPPLLNTCLNYNTTYKNSSPIQHARKTIWEVLENSIIFSLFIGYAVGFSVVSLILFLVRERFNLVAFKFMMNEL